MNSANDKQRKALGKGLSALLPGRGQANNVGMATVAAPVTTIRPGTLPLSLIQPNPMQPRTVFHSDGPRSWLHPYARTALSNLLLFASLATATRSWLGNAAGGPPDWPSCRKSLW